MELRDQFKDHWEVKNLMIPSAFTVSSFLKHEKLDLNQCRSE